MNCFYCDVLLSKTTSEKDHFPVPQELGGTEVVDCCTSCHDMKDRFLLDDWPIAWLSKVLSDFPKLNRETRLFLAKGLRLILLAKASQEKAP